MMLRDTRRASWLSTILAGVALGGAAVGAPPATAAAGTRWAYVEHRAVVRDAPYRRGRHVAALSTRTYSGAREAVVVLRLGRSWARVHYAGRGRRVGWIPTASLGGRHLVHARVRVSLARRRLTVTRAGRTVLRVPVGVGAPDSPTPAGHVYVRERLSPRPGTLYGAVAFGLSAYSRFRTDWPGGGQVGLHGTNQPWLIPGAVSNGCIRLRDPDVRHLDHLIGVGTPVEIG